MIKGKLTFNLDKAFPARIKDKFVTALEYGALAWEREAKILTTKEKHVVTGRYRASINLNTADGIVRETVSATRDGDGIHEVDRTNIKIKVGTNVEYAIYLERRYNLITRALNNSLNDIRKYTASKFKQLNG